MAIFDGAPSESEFRQAWQSVRIARSVPYTLFTFGESELPYFLVLAGDTVGEGVTLTRGEIRITRPLIITPENAQPELNDFFENDHDEQFASFILARTANFSHLRMQNLQGEEQLQSESVEDVVAKLNRRLDAEDEDRIAILTSPKRLAGLAVLRYATERILQSAPSNLTELREKGFLP